MRNICLIALLIWLPWTALGQAAPKPTAKPPTKLPDKLTVSFPEAGERAWWLADKAGEPLNAPTNFGDKQTVVDLKANPGAASLLVEDRKTGNLAVSPLAGLAGKDALSLGPADFKFASVVKVQINKENKPVYNVTVRLKDSSERPAQSTIISRGEPGVATFRQVAHGKITIEVLREGGKDTHDETLEATRQEPTPTFTYATTANVPTADPAPAAGAAPTTEPAPTASPGGSIGQIALLLIAIGVAIAVLYGALRLVQGNNEKVAGAMQKLGVQLPDPAASTSGAATAAPAQQAPPVVPDGFCPFCGEKKDANGNCACTLGAGASTAASAGASPTGLPRLVGLQGPYAGRIFDLNDPAVSVGRETDNAVPLDQDATVSRRHAQISGAGGSFTVQDLGSSNGTFVNDNRITGEHALRPGDTVQFGTSKFKFEA